MPEKTTGPWTKIRDLVSFLAGLALLYHETVIIPDPPGPRMLLLAIAVPLLGVAPAAITNRWLGGPVPETEPTTTKKKTDEQDSNANR